MVAPGLQRQSAGVGVAGRAVGILLVVVLIATILRRWGVDTAMVRWMSGLAFVTAIALMVPGVRWGRRSFVIVAVALSLAAVLMRGAEGQAAVSSAIGLAGFVAAFFSALSTLGKAAATSPAIHRAGKFLAQQPPTRRYAALTVGGQLFSLVLNYGAVQLLGSLAVSSLKDETSARIREIRTRRMLLAIERALISTLTWSPLTYSVTLVSLLIPDIRWDNVVLPGIVSGLILALTGWLLDSLRAPRRTGASQERARASGSIADLYPLLILLVLIGGLVLSISRTFHVGVPGIVILVVPLISIGWIALQQRREAGLAGVGRWVRDYTFTQLPQMRSEVVLLSMAAWIGSVGGFLFAPVAASLLPDLGAGHGWLILAALIWIITATGQVGMNPLMTVTLIVPALPPTQDLGISPAAMFLALTAGWALNGISTPFSAIAVILSGYSGTTPRQIGLNWNGLYTLVAGTLLTVWVMAYALWTA